MPDSSEKHLPTVAVVIPAYNIDPYVARAIESALTQTHKADQIIVVDDGSTDATAERIKQAIDALSPQLTQAEETAGAASQESVTWNTAFASTPVVTSSSVGTSGANSTEVFTVLEARSTTGATGDTTDVDGAQRSHVKTFIAQVS